MLVISPWSKGGRVCSELFDHTSTIRFLEEWLVAGLRKDRTAVACKLISPWRRAVCGDLTSAFEFAAPDSKWPSSVPKSAAYRLVTGKPMPKPPAVQVRPGQEPYPAASGPRHACALPYRLSVHAQVRPNRQLLLSFVNAGTSGAALNVYSRERSGGPWYYALEAGKQIDHDVWNWTTELYDLSVYGPNGFLRVFKGGGAAATEAGGAGPEVSVACHTGNGNIMLSLSNRARPSACIFSVTDNTYGTPARAVSVPGGFITTVEVALAASHGGYDLSVTSKADAQWLRRFAGHVETGAPSRTDPAIGRNSARALAVPAG